MCGFVCMRVCEFYIIKIYLRSVLLTNKLRNEQSCLPVSTIREREQCSALYCRCLCGAVTTKGWQWDERKPIITPNLPRRGPRWSGRPRKLYSLSVVEDRFLKRDFNVFVIVYLKSVCTIDSPFACRLRRTTSCCCCKIG